jgi:hypothetical protein
MLNLFLCHIIVVVLTNISEELTPSVFYPEDGSSITKVII